MAAPASLPDFPRPLLDRIVQRCLTSEDEPLAVLVTGSYAAGLATPQSDLDLTTLLRGEPEIDYRTWFEDRPGRVLHVSAGFKRVEDWLARYDEPAVWSLGFPTETAAQFLWATSEARSVLPDPPHLRRPTSSPELEDFVEGAMKARRALAAGDHLGARFHAHAMATLAPGLLIPLNPERRVGDRRGALESALSLPVAPAHYQQDLIACLGLEAIPDALFEEVVWRLPEEMLAFLRDRCPEVDPQPELARYLLDGTLQRHLST